MSAKASLKVAAAFEGKFGCEIELFQFVFPAPGLLGLGLGAIVPIKAGFEISGKVTVTSIELGAEASAATGLELGVVCPPGSGCEVVNKMADIKTTWKPKVDGPSWTDVRLEVSVEVFGAADVLIGPPFVEALQLNLVRAKAGAKLSADWAPQAVQIADKAYGSSYGLTLEAGVEIGAKLTDIAEMLGASDIASTELKLSKDLAHSPTGKVTFDRASYVTGDTGVAKVVMDPTDLDFLGAYNVERVLLVQHTPTEDRVLDTSAGAAEGQRDFELRFTATSPISTSDLYAFVVTKFPTLDSFALEVRQSSGARIAYLKGNDIYTMAPDGTGQTLVTPNGSAPAISPDGTKIAFATNRDGNLEIYVVNADGTGLTNLTHDPGIQNFPAWSADGTRIAFTGIGTQVYVMGASGGPATRVTDGTGGSRAGALRPAWSPDGSRLAFDGSGNTGSGICTVAVSGGAGTCLDLPVPPHIAVGGFAAWSPDGLWLAFQMSQFQQPPGQDQLTYEWAGVALIPIGGGAPVRIAEGGLRPAWSRDGRDILFCMKGDIYSVATDGTNMTRLTFAPEQECYPSWGGG